MAGAINTDGFWLPIATDPADVPEAFVNFVTKSTILAKMVTRENKSDPYTMYLTASRGDARYSRTNHAHSTNSSNDKRYLRLTGGKISGNLEVTGNTIFRGTLSMGPGTNLKPAFIFLPDGPTTGMYAHDKGEISFTMEGQRTLSIVSAGKEAAMRGRVIVRANVGVPLRIERGDSAASSAVMMRFRAGTSAEINITVKNLLALAKL